MNKGSIPPCPVLGCLEGLTNPRDHLCPSHRAKLKKARDPGEKLLLRMLKEGCCTAVDCVRVPWCFQPCTEDGCTHTCTHHKTVE